MPSLRSPRTSFSAACRESAGRSTGRRCATAPRACSAEMDVADRRRRDRSADSVGRRAAARRDRQGARRRRLDDHPRRADDRARPRRDRAAARASAAPKAQGSAILYISHRLDEVVELVDCVTILKDGRVASARGESRRFDIPFIVRTMVGDVGEHYPKERNATGDVAARGRRPRHATTASAASASRSAAARSSASAACSARAAPSSPARCSASIALIARRDRAGRAGRCASPARRQAIAAGHRARAGEPQVRRALLQLRRLPEHLHRRARTGSAGTA